MESFPLYPEKFLSSLDLQAMECCEFGIYCKILFASFIQERPCYIKNDDKILAKLCGITQEQWQQCKKTVLKEFKNDGDYLFSETLLGIYQKECKGSKKKKKVQLTMLTTMLNYTFDSFWNDYDKKVGSTERLIPKWLKLSDKEREEIRIHIPKYKQASPEKQYRKNAETYLNQRTWEHEIINYNKKQKNDLGDTTKQSASQI